MGALVAMLLLLTRHPNHSAPTAQTSNAKSMMDQPVIIENRGEQVRWKLHALKAEQGLKQMHLIQPHLEIFDHDGSAIPIEGDEAWFNPLQRNARFVGHVRIDYRQWHLQSTEALFEGSTGKLHIAGKFSAHGDHVTMVGKDLTVDQPHQQIEVRHHVKIEDQR